MQSKARATCTRRLSRASSGMATTTPVCDSQSNGVQAWAVPSIKHGDHWHYMAVEEDGGDNFCDDVNENIPDERLVKARVCLQNGPHGNLFACDNKDISISRCLCWMAHREARQPGHQVPRRAILQGGTQHPVGRHTATGNYQPMVTVLRDDAHPGGPGGRGRLLSHAPEVTGPCPLPSRSLRNSRCRSYWSRQSWITWFSV